MQKEEVKAFKYELRNYSFLLREIAKIRESIGFIYDRLGGVRGIDPGKEPLHSLPDKDLEYKLRDEIERLEARLSIREAERQRIDQILAGMESPLKEAIKDIYIKGEKFEKVARRIGYSHNGLYKQINREIERSLHGEIHVSVR